MPASDPKTRRTSPFRRAILWVGLACCLQFLVFGVVGVVRGYSVQSWIPQWLLLAGFLILIPFSWKHRMASLMTSGMLLLFALVSLSQGKHAQRGEELYEAGKYGEAIVEYRKEIDTWHHRLMFNHREAACMFGIAECHSQLEQFADARDTYVEMTRRFHGYYKGRAEQALLDLDANLAKVRDHEKRLADIADAEEEALLRFDLAIVYRQLTCSSKAIEQYEAIQALDIPEPFKEQARKFAGKLR
jgi:tetratricopeptide (TPR) repeat protein